MAWGQEVAQLSNQGEGRARSGSSLSPRSPCPPGDFAYNMDQDNARVGDKFMRLIEPVAASLPYMTCPGNHEER